MKKKCIRFLPLLLACLLLGGCFLEPAEDFTPFRSSQRNTMTCRTPSNWPCRTVRSMPRRSPAITSRSCRWSTSTATVRTKPSSTANDR